MIKININKFKSEQFETQLLKPKNNLFPEFWENNTLNKAVSERLLEIAKNILESMDIKVEVSDIIITGSICSYNWHKYSDIDLHIMLEFSEFGDKHELVKKMLDQSRINWNKTHNILISDKEVELYFQDSKEPHEANGIWSLTQNKWLAEPVKLNPSLDLRNAEKKAETIAKAISHISEMVEDKHFEEAYNYSSKVKLKISNMRKSGLESEGIYSPENLAFKMLRYSGYLEKLSFLKVLSYDKMMSLSVLSEIHIKDYFSDKKDPDYLKYDEHPQSTTEKLLDLNEKAPWEES